MTFLAKIMALGVVIYLIKVFLYPIYKPTSKKQKKRAQQFVKDRKKEQAKQRSKSRKRAFIKEYGKYLMTKEKRERLAKMLNRLDMDMLPEEIRLQQLTYALTAVGASLVMMCFNQLLGFAVAIFIVLGWLMPVDDLEKKIDKKNKNIARDFPAFYSMVYYQYSKTINIYLADVIKDFMPNANRDMADELGVMLDNIDYGEEYALKQFKKRVPSHYIIKFCDIMETRLKGYDNISQMTYLKNEIDEFRVRALEEELAQRQAANERLQFFLIVILVVYIVIYFLFTTLGAFKMFA